MADNGIMVAGSLHFDIVIDAPHLPGTDETVMGGPVRFLCGGKGGNQAVAAARHGANVAMAATVGRDWFGERLVDNLRQASVDISQLQYSATSASGMSVAIVDKHAEYGAVVATGANLGFDPSQVEVPRDTGLLVLQNEIPEGANLAMAKQAKAVGAGIVLNAAPMRQVTTDLQSYLDVLILNRVEATAWFEGPAQTPAQAVGLADGRVGGPPVLIITLGAAGLVLHEIGKAARYLPAHEVEAQSMHGAGDVFIGAFAARLVVGASLQDAAAYGQAAAAEFVGAHPDRRDKPDLAAVAAMVKNR